MEVQKQSYRNTGERWDPFNTFAKYVVLQAKLSQGNGFHVWYTNIMDCCPTSEVKQWYPVTPVGKFFIVWLILNKL